MNKVVAVKTFRSYFEQINLSEKSLNIIARLNDQESIKKLVASGLGISFISAKAITDADNLLTIKLPENSLTRSYILLIIKTIS